MKKTLKEWVSGAEKLTKDNGGVVQKCHTKADDLVAVAENLAKENGGELHNDKWLMSNGYGHLYDAIYRRPELFAHIQQVKLKKSPEEWVPIAEDLAKKNGGFLPDFQSLGYGGLYLAIRKRPELFNHIPRKCKGWKTPKEWVPIAEKLAKKNGGKLQNYRWLVKNGYGGLAQARKNHPELFIHILQEYKNGKTPEEWVPIAEKLAKKNDGELPSSGWLRRNGFNGLDQMMWKHPSLFKHITRFKGGKTSKEWVPVAEDLAKKNGGKLQNRFWLQNNGYKGLANSLINRPQLFSHIPQEYKGGKPPKEWVPIAEDLAKKNGGKLQNYQWLVDNGYRGLTNTLAKFPELFAHISQEVLHKCKREKIATLVASLAQEDSLAWLPSIALTYILLQSGIKPTSWHNKLLKGFQNGQLSLKKLIDGMNGEDVEFGKIDLLRKPAKKPGVEQILNLLRNPIFAAMDSEAIEAIMLELEAQAWERIYENEKEEIAKLMSVKF